MEHLKRFCAQVDVCIQNSMQLPVQIVVEAIINQIPNPLLACPVVLGVLVCLVLLNVSLVLQEVVVLLYLLRLVVYPVKLDIILILLMLLFACLCCRSICVSFVFVL